MSRFAPPPPPFDGVPADGAPADGARSGAALDVFVATVRDECCSGRLRRRLLAAEPCDAHLRQVFLAAGGRRLLWHFRAANTVAVVDALRRSNATPAGLWSGTARALGANPTAMVEHGTTSPADGDGHPPPELCLLTHRVEPAGTLICAGRIVLSFYRAPDVESVRLAQRHAGVPAERIWGLQRLG